jgi:hypothetical protein
LAGVPGCVQVWANAESIAVNQPTNAAATNITRFVFTGVLRFQKTWAQPMPSPITLENAVYPSEDDHKMRDSHAKCVKILRGANRGRVVEVKFNRQDAKNASRDSNTECRNSGN